MLLQQDFFMANFINRRYNRITSACHKWLFFGVPKNKDMQSSMMNFAGIRDYILENELTDSIVIVLHPDTFDAVALDYIKIHESIERPFEILGIEIVEDTSGSVYRNQIKIMEQ